jgi:hypothetical protein
MQRVLATIDESADAEKRQRSAWLDSPYTRQLRKELEEKYEEMKESWARGSFVVEDNYMATAMRNLAAVTELQTIRQIMSVINGD